MDTAAAERVKKLEEALPKPPPPKKPEPPLTWNPGDAKSNGGRGTRPGTATEVPTSTKPRRRGK